MKVLTKTHRALTRLCPGGTQRAQEERNGMSEDIIPQSAWNLIRAKGLILDEDNWCQEGHEKDGCFSMTAALMAAEFSEGTGAGWSEAYAALKNLSIMSIVVEAPLSFKKFNNRSSHGEVIRAFDCAIANEIARANGRYPTMHQI